MSKKIELYDDSMDSIVEQIQRTASDLKGKRKLLLDQIDLYKDLQAKVDMKAEKAMVLLGDGYFVEMSPNDAKKYLTRRINSIHEIIGGFNIKIKDAENTMEHISKFREIEIESDKKEVINEEGLPFLDIQEELDDEDNITSVKINNEKQAHESQCKNEKPADEGLPMMDIQEELDEDGNVKSVKINNKVQLIDDQIEKKESKNSKRNEQFNSKERNKNFKKIEEIDGNEEEEEDDDQLSELLQDMGIIQLKKTDEINIDQDKLLDKIDQLNINSDEKFKLKQICVEGYKSLQVEKTSNEDIQEKGEQTDEEIISDLIVENDLQDLLSTDDKTNSHQKDTDSNRIAIDGNDLLELELIADKFVDTNNSSITHADDEEWDFEFDDEEEEEDEDFSDDLLYGSSGATFIPQTESRPGSQNLNNLLWKQVMELRNKKAQGAISDSTHSLKKKSVRFSEQLEIKEIENISEELKNIDHFKQNISRFKQDRLIKSNDFEIKDAIKQLEKTNEETVERDKPVSDIVERNEPVSDIFERDIITRNPISGVVEDPIEKPHIGEVSKSTVRSDTNKPKISKFKQMKATPASLQQSPKHRPVKKPIKPFEITDIERGKTRKSVIEESIKETEDNPIHIMDTSLDYNSMQQDMDTMVKAYALGMYDDDIITEGPVVQQLDDFEKLNKIIESMPKPEASTAKSVKSANGKVEEIFDPYLDQVGGEHQDDDDDDDNSPLLGEILENDIVPPPDIEQSILNQEVTSNYHRLRQKLFFSENEYRQDNKEFEPIDEHGNNLRISKFKASKLGLNH